MKLDTRAKDAEIGNNHHQIVNEEAILKGSNQVPLVREGEEWRSLQPVQVMKEEVEIPEEINLTRKE